MSRFDGDSADVLTTRPQGLMKLYGANTVFMNKLILIITCFEYYFKWRIKVDKKINAHLLG